MDSNTRLGRRGEQLVLGWATDADITANQPDYDDHGWDFILEAPAPKPIRSAKTADMRPGLITCFVQVKSVGTGADRVSVPLRVWERLVKAELPCFFMVLKFTGGNPTDAFLVHVDHDWIEAVLRRLRKIVAVDTESASRMTLDLTWKPEQRLPAMDGEALRAALLAIVKEGPVEYTRDKLKFVETCGYSERPFKGTFKFKADSQAQLEGQLIDLQTGKLPSLQVDVGEVEHVRFGIPVTVAPAAQGAVLRLPDLQALHRSTIVARNRSGTSHVQIECDTYPSWYGLARTCKRKKVRFVAPMFEMSVDFEGTAATISWQVDLPPPDKEIALDQAVRVARLWLMLDAAGEDPVTFTQVPSEAAVISLPPMTLDRRPDFTGAAKAEATNIAELGRVVSQFELNADVPVRLGEALERHTDVAILATVLSSQLQKIEFELSVNAATPPIGPVAYLWFPGVVLSEHILVAAVAAYGTVRSLGLERPGWQRISLEGVRVVCIDKWIVSKNDWPKFNKAAKSRAARGRIKRDLGISFIISPKPERKGRKRAAT